LVVDKLLTPEQVAAVLNLSVRTVKGWLREGKLKGVKIGTRGDWRVKESDLEKYISKQNGK
jgi:excisionase family DNA binding protein